jgi:predicted RNase H-like HicB family nuclease
VAKDIEHYIHLAYAVEVVPESTTDGMPCYRASHPELPGCMAHGETPDEARENLDDARRLYIETLLAKRLQVPLPFTATGAASSFAEAVIWTILNPEGTAQRQVPAEDIVYTRTQ